MKEKHEEYDVIVVGSGAGGGMAAHVLTQKGLRVLMLEAGRDYNPVSETPMFNTPEQAPLRGDGTPDKEFGYYDATIDGGWHVAGEPYTVAPGSDEFRWWRPRMLGGRTNHWGRIALRFGPYDFKPYSRDGLGVDWPISYEEMAPWYDLTERYIGVTGLAHGLENTPDSPPGVHHVPPPPRAHEMMMTRAFGKMNIPVAAMRAAIITRPINGRSACLYATECGRGCAVAANFQSTTVLLPPARATGNLTTRTQAVVYQVDVDKSGHATGVSFIDRLKGTHHSVRAKAVVLAAGACASARILLNSRSAQFPDGVGNSTGFVGRYLMDTVGSSTVGYIPMLEKLPPRNDDGMSVSHIYVPWWGYQQQARKELDFPRGYHIEPNGGSRMPGMSMGDMAMFSKVSHGAGLRDEIRRQYGAYISFDGRGEMIPNDDCYMDLDPNVKDRWGIPVPRFHWKWSQHEERQAAHMRRTFLEVIDRLGGTAVDGTETDGKKAIAKGGEMIHEVGAVRMGTSAANSVVDSYGRTWDARNLFVLDGGILPSNPDKNPTLSILALAWRGAEHLVELSRKGEL
ncbi:MAG: GMC family oxidoreductase [Burkholderiaceae bacterium]|nr:GMC family oxidoreductase [Burkholderiaceae bacterium]